MAFLYFSSENQLFLQMKPFHLDSSFTLFYFLLWPASWKNRLFSRSQELSGSPQVGVNGMEVRPHVPRARFSPGTLVSPIPISEPTRAKEFADVS